MIRAAHPHDAAQSVPLIIDAIGNIAHVLAGTSNPSKTEQILHFYFVQPSNRLSFENTLVAVSEKGIVGVLICYHGSRQAALDLPFTNTLMPLERETRPDEFYLDTVSVHADYQGRGIGSELISAFEALASQRGYAKLALIAECENTAANRLYARLGYVTDDTLLLYGHQYNHRVKYMPPAMKS